MAGTDFSHLTTDELIKGIKALDLPDYIRSKAYGIDVRETLAQMTEMTIQLGVNMGLSPEDALNWARKLQQSVSQSEFDSWVATLLDGGPSIFMNTLSELQTTYPNGAAGVALVRETDPAKIYVWNGSAWEDFGDYQGIAIKDGAVKFNNLSPYLKRLVTDFTEKESSSVKGRVFIEQGIYQINSATAYLENKNLFRGYDVGYVQVGAGLQGGYSDRRRSQPIALSETERLTLTISGDINRHVWAFLDVDGNDMGVGVDEETVTAPVGAYWAQCYYYNGADNPPVGGNVQIEIGEASTTYTKNERITLKNDEPFEVGGNFSLVALYRSNLTKFVSKKIIGNKPEVYGVKYDPLQSNPKIERINDNNDSVDFDTIYPWSDIKVVNVKKTAWGATHITYKNESTFSLDGSNGDVMVEIPKHYVRRYREDGYEYVLISKHEQEGFEVDPAFIENGKVLDKIYVGRYMNIVENNVPLSKSGTRPTANTNVPQAVEKSVAKGRGFNNFDFRTLQMLQRLFLVEYATRDSQSIFGGITKYVYHGKPECLALASGTGVNQITIKIGHESDKFRVGQSCAVSVGQEFQFRTITNIVSNATNGQRVITFSGEPTNITSGQTYIYSNPEASGKTDNLENFHGRLTGDSDKVSFSYRGIENLWGNLHELVAGVYTQYGAAFIANNMSEYSDMPSEVYRPTLWQLPNIPYTGPQDATTPYIRTMGYDPNNPLIMLPNSAGTSTVGADHWTDEINAPHSDQAQYLAHGGGWDHYERSGLFNYRFFVDSTNPDSGWLNGTRLIFKNI